MKFLRRCLKLCLWVICYPFPVNNKKIVILSYYGRGYGDNPKYIAEKLLEKRNDLKIVWIVKNDYEAATLPKGIIPCVNSLCKTIYHLCTAKIWIDNCRKGFSLKKKSQKYLQTWHGFGPKRIERDVESVLAKSYVSNAIRDSKNIDLIVSNSMLLTRIYNNSFWYDGEVQEWGSPRNDIIIKKDNNIKNKVKKELCISDDKNILLYAPTFRANLGMNAYLKEFDTILKECETKFNNEFVVVLRLHPNIADKFEQLSLDGRKIINGTFYPDLQELLLATDVLISDYSSLMFDYFLARKPCFIFATDIEEYKKDRNFYFDLSSTPFSISTNEEELGKSIRNFNNEEYIEKIEQFVKRHGIIDDGNSSERCAKWILSQM